MINKKPALCRGREISRGTTSIYCRFAAGSLIGYFIPLCSNGHRRPNLLRETPVRWAALRMYLGRICPRLSPAGHSLLTRYSSYFFLVIAFKKLITLIIAKKFFLSSTFC